MATLVLPFLCLAFFPILYFSLNIHELFYPQLYLTYNKKKIQTLTRVHHVNHSKVEGNEIRVGITLLTRV